MKVVWVVCSAEMACVACVRGGRVVLRLPRSALTGGNSPPLVVVCLLLAHPPTLFEVHSRCRIQTQLCSPGALVVAFLNGANGRSIPLPGSLPCSQLAGGGPQPFLLLGLGPGVCACLFSSHLLCLTPQFGALLVFVAVRQSLLRVEDYWEGYKLFCYSYYSHSVPHEVEFRRCKLGAFFWRPPLLFSPWHVFLLLVPCMRACTCYECLCLISSLPSLLQVSLYGAAMGHQAFLPTTQYAPRACSCSPL